ncbi:MAG: hypothetical protein KC502_09055 [Myxococcales bacterium]|nr:hypothetical protein [Myxococcales bacterium]
MRKCEVRRAAARSLTFGLITAMTLLTVTPAFADVGDVINVQGRLVSQAGTPVPDGQYTMTLGFYKTKAAAKALYSYIAVGVQVTKGTFAVRVGEKFALDKKVFASGEAGWLGVTIGGDAELPRLALAKVPYAIRADSAAAADSAASAAKLACSGCIDQSHLDAKFTATLAKKGDLSAVATSGKYKDLTGKPTLVKTTQTCAKGEVAAGIDAAGKLTCVKDKNDATVYTGKDFALSNQKCASGKVLAGLDSAGKAICVTDKDTNTTYTGKNFALANKTCPSGTVMRGVTSLGTPNCIKDANSTYSGKNFALSNKLCPSGYVMRGVTSSGTPNCIKDANSTYSGKNFALSNKLCPSGYLMRGVTSSGTPNCVKPTAVGITSVKGWSGRSGSSSGWTSSGGWGEPRFSSSSAHTATAGSTTAGKEYMDFAIPSGSKTAWISVMAWNNGGYFDILLKKSNVWKFHRRLSSYQAISNSSGGGTHDGNVIQLAGTGLNHFTHIRIQNRKGRIHFTGLGFSPEDMQSNGGSGFPHWDNVVNRPKVAYTSTIAADDFNQTEVNNLRAGKLDNGTTPWTSGTSHNHTYNVNDAWLRDNGDNAHVKLYGNKRTLVMRTDGTAQYGSNGGYPFLWLYGGDGTGNRLMMINTAGQLWLKNYGWLHDKFQAKGSYLPTAGGTITGNLSVKGTLTVGSTLHANNGVSVDGKVVIDNGAGWHRSYGATGWYNGTYGGGMTMTDTTYVRVYGGKILYNDKAIRGDGGIYVGGTHVAKGNQSCPSGQVLKGFNNSGNKICTAGATGVVFRRWGRTGCPSGTSLVYWGYMGKSYYGHGGSGNDYQCLHRTPNYFTYNTGNHDEALMYGVEYEMSSNAIGKAGYHDYNAPCAVCYAPNKNTQFMQPGRYTCPSGWTTTYNGYLMAERHNHSSSNWVCVDKSFQNIGSKANQNGGLLYPTEIECGSMPCSSGKYQQNKEITCAVCLK